MFARRMTGVVAASSRRLQQITDGIGESFRLMARMASNTLAMQTFSFRRLRKGSDREGEFLAGCFLR
jgi:hypothetical protein